MIVITAENLHKSYGEKVLFDDITFNITDLDKIGLIGVNGTGKTSLLNIISGIDSPDKGTISSPKGTKIEYLSQNPVFEDDVTVLEYVFMGESPLLKLISNYERVIELSNEEPDNLEIQNDLLRLSADMDKHHAWDLESQVKTVLTKLGITDFNRSVQVLSGGQKKRIALARVLISPCDLLILDEPTNHMDNETIVWLEAYLKARKGALLMITHDRYFLDRVVNRTLELDLGVLHSYDGNYSTFVEKKAERRELSSTLEKKRQNLYKKELEWIRTGAKARTTKQKARIQRFDDLKDTSFHVDDTKMEMNTGHSRLGKKIIEIENVYKSFGDINILENFSYIVTRNDRIGIIGDNGIGKSSLLNLIANKIQPDSGTIDIGKTVQIGYFSQESEEMDESLRVIEYIKDTASHIKTAGGEEITAAIMMERFLFSKDMQWTYIHKLSGGEKRRLYLLKVIMESPNVIILDEPTNDLDIDTLNVLESYIDDFDGIILTVSHDRYFLDRVCQKIFSFQGNGKVVEHTGNYSDFLEYKRKFLDAPSDIEPKKKAPQVTQIKKTSKVKFTYNEKREFETIEADITALEEQINDIDKQVESNPTDFVLLQELSEKKDEIEMELLEKMERFEYLSEIYDASTN